MEIDSVGPKELALGLAAFLCVCLGAAAIGMIGGFATAFITKFTSDIHCKLLLTLIVPCSHDACL